MKFVLSLMLPFVSLAAFAADSGNPFEAKCNTHDNLARVETAVVKEIRETVQKEDENAEAFSFNFSHIVPVENGADLTVYFERVSTPANATMPDEKGRKAYIAQYRVNQENCSPTLLTVRPLMRSTARFADFASSPSDHCDTDAALSKIHGRIQQDIDYLYRQIIPGGQLTNFAFTPISRSAGSANIVALFETSRPGIATRPNVTQFSVDPQTCEAHYVSSTGFAWLLITY